MYRNAGHYVQVSKSLRKIAKAFNVNIALDIPFHDHFESYSSHDTLLNPLSSVPDDNVKNGWVDSIVETVLDNIHSLKTKSQ